MLIIHLELDNKYVRVGVLKKDLKKNGAEVVFKEALKALLRDKTK